MGVAANREQAAANLSRIWIAGLSDPSNFSDRYKAGLSRHRPLQNLGTIGLASPVGSTTDGCKEQGKCGHSRLPHLVASNLKLYPGSIVLYIC
jgi:hypothetical protein